MSESLEPVAWRYSTPNGYVVCKTKVNGHCEPLYASPPSDALDATASSIVQRYDEEGHECPGGAAVAYEDYEALNRHLESANSKLRRCVSELRDKSVELAALAAKHKKLRELAKAILPVPSRSTDADKALRAAIGEEL